MNLVGKIFLTSTHARAWILKPEWSYDLTSIARAQARALSLILDLGFVISAASKDLDRPRSFLQMGKLDQANFFSWESETYVRPNFNLSDRTPF